jgi:hypothetical protein
MSVRPKIEAMLGVQVRRIGSSYRLYPRYHRAWRVQLRRGKWIEVDLECSMVMAERWGLAWRPLTDPSAAKTIRDIYESGDDPGPESDEGKRRVTMEDYVAWRMSAVRYLDLGSTIRHRYQIEN